MSASSLPRERETGSSEWITGNTTKHLRALCVLLASGNIQASFPPPPTAPRPPHTGPCVPALTTTPDQRTRRDKEQ
ncbi:unnamed protein product [Arctogadus glacialis]